MALLSKDDILNSQDTLTKRVNVPEWGGEVIIRVMSGYVRDKYEESCIGKNGGTNLANVRAKMVAASLVDEEGKLLFSESDVIKLGKKSSKALDRIFIECQKLNSYSDSDVEELAKN